MALQAASAPLEVAAGSASGRIWAEDAGQCGMLGDDVRRIEISDLQTVRASTPYRPVLEPGIEEIG
jgi:hypothetical protein